MASWDGKERRNLNNGDDWLKRDRMLTEVHSDMKHLVEWSKSHDTLDNNRFKAASDRIDWLEKVAYLGIGGIVVMEVIIKLFL